MKDQRIPQEPTPQVLATPAATVPKQVSIGAVVVTRNRLALLQECVAALRAQTRVPDEIIIIDNASDDGTRHWLATQNDLTVILQGNLGGAGGFHRGIKEAHARGHDWFWCMDDDTIAQPTALERLCEAPPFSDARTGFLGSLVQWTDGSPHKMNMWLSAHYVRPITVGWYGNLLRDKCVPVDTSSFVSILIRRGAVERVGLPLKEMFIWCDDAEYTYRLSRHFLNYHVLDSVVVHKTPDNRNGSFETITPAEYFKLSHGLRNEIYFRRVQGGFPILRDLRIFYHILKRTRVLLKARAPFYLLRSLWSGLFFKPRIERVRAIRSTNAETSPTAP